MNIESSNRPIIRENQAKHNRNYHYLINHPIGSIEAIKGKSLQEFFGYKMHESCVFQTEPSGCNLMLYTYLLLITSCMCVRGTSIQVLLSINTLSCKLLAQRE